MKIQLRKIGNSVGQIIPANLLQELDLQVGDTLDLSVLNGQLVAKPLKQRPRYTLDELLAKCDENAPLHSALDDWDNLEAVGLENDL